MFVWALEMTVESRERKRRQNRVYALNLQDEENGNGRKYKREE